MFVRLCGCVALLLLAHTRLGAHLALPFTAQVSKDEEGATTLTCPSVDKGYVYPEEVGAMVLAQLLDHAEAAAATGDGQRVTKAVISVPAYFSRQQRDATAAAGRLAGLETVRLLREPVAAALAYGLDLREDRTVLVFDLGGGTYDISILEVGNGTVEVLSTGDDDDDNDVAAAAADLLARSTGLCV